MATAAARAQIHAEPRQNGMIRLIREHPLATIGAITAVFYLVYLLHAFTGGYGPRSFIRIERRQVLSSHASHVVKVEPGFPYVLPGSEYDGGNYYLIALDPVNARHYVTAGTYFYSRALYPLTARALALGAPGLIPYTLILVNLISVVWGTVMLAAWLRRKELPPWFALIYAGYSGIFVAFQRDLTEPMAYALLATGIYILQFGGKRRVLWSALCFGLAVLTRDKAAILALVAILGFLFSNETRPGLTHPAQVARNLPSAVFLGSMTIIPYAGLKFFLYLWMHSLTLPVNQQTAPLSAIFASRVTGQILLSDVLTALIPAFICLVMTLWALVRGARDLSLAALLLLIFVTTVTLTPVYFVDVVGLMRATILVVMASLYALPTIDAATHGNRKWLYLCALFWLSMTPSLFITSGLFPWIQVLAVLVVFAETALVFAARRGLRVLRSRSVPVV